MKNEENRNPEQQDQLIRETFEQYRAGMESMPSQRAKIVYRMTEKPARDSRVYYRLAAVAAAMVLLLGIVVPTVGGNSGLFRWPDQQRNTPDQIAAQPAPTDFVPLAMPEEQPAYFAEIRAFDPNFVSALVPVDAGCEKEGIRLEVLYGAVREDQAMLIYSLRDLEGKNRINELTENPVFPGISGFDRYEDILSEYDAENQQFIGGMVIYYQDLASCLEESAVPLRMSRLDVCSQVSAVCARTPEDNVSPGLVELPELMDYYIRSVNGGKREYYTTEDYRAAGRKVIDYSTPAGQVLSSQVLLSHDGVYGDEFHVQLQYKDWAYWPLRNVDVVLLDEEGIERGPDGWEGHMRWDTDRNGDPDFEEFVFSIDPEVAGSLRYRVDITETTEVVEENWEVKVPLSGIWTGVAEYSDIVDDIALYPGGWTPADVYELYPQFKGELVPVHLTSEDQGIRLDVMYSAVKEHEAVLIYSLEDLDGERVNGYTEEPLRFPAVLSPDDYSVRPLCYIEDDHMSIFLMYCQYNQLPEMNESSGMTLDLQYLNIYDSLDHTDAVDGISGNWAVEVPLEYIRTEPAEESAE